MSWRASIVPGARRLTPTRAVRLFPHEVDDLGIILHLLNAPTVLHATTWEMRYLSRIDPHCRKVRRPFLRVCTTRWRRVCMKREWKSYLIGTASGGPQHTGAGALKKILVLEKDVDVVVPPLVHRESF